jgi:hypothetical protein
MMKPFVAIFALLGAAAVAVWAAPASLGTTENAIAHSVAMPREIVTPREQSVHVALASHQSSTQALTLDMPGSDGQLAKCSATYVACRAAGLNPVACQTFYNECRLVCILKSPFPTRSRTRC